MTDIVGKLQKEIQDVARPYLERIQELETLAHNKRHSIRELEQEAGAKEQQIETLKAEAQATLGRCGDPRPLLSKISNLRSQQEDLHVLVANAGQLDQAEQEQIKNLKDELFKVVHEKIGYSKLREQNAKALLDAMRQVVKVHDDWNQAVKTVCSDLGIENQNHRLLHFKDESEESTLAGRIKAFANKHAHLFGAA